MLKQTTITLGGRDHGLELTLSELPALVADRAARRILKSLDADTDGGVVALALKHLGDVRKLGEAGLHMLMPFVQATRTDCDRPATLTTLIKDWRNIERVQQAALALHVGFIVDRELIEAPVTMRAEQLLDSIPDIRVTFCAPFIAAVLESGKATYRELETVLSTEDAFNIVEILNVRAIRDWHATQEKP